ncbi:hypothetical protein D3C81_1341570 [compost metagenome]
MELADAELHTAPMRFEPAGLHAGQEHELFGVRAEIALRSLVIDHYHSALSTGHAFCMHSTGLIVRGGLHVHSIISLKTCRSSPW